jgi:glucose-6-phosphate isomerase
LVSHLVVSRIWEHDYTLWSQLPVEIENRLAWLRVAGGMHRHLDRMNKLRERLLSEGFTDVLLLGMGGSSLAPEVLSKTFPDSKGLKLSILDTTVPGEILEVGRRLDPRTTVYIVSTKSGGTVETLSLFKHFYNSACDALGAAEGGKRFIAITDPGSSLEATAKELNLGELFINEPNLGGRYAALSLVGLVPAALMGLDLEKLLASARLASADARPDESPLTGNPAARLGAIMGTAALAGRDKLTLVASPGVASLADWIEQLVAESTGKEGKGILPVAGEELSVADDYGDDRLFVSVTLAGEEDLERQARLDDLADAGHPVVCLTLPDSYGVGGQFFFWEFATAVASWFLGIHPFNQPDVESAKVAARGVVEDYKATGELEVAAPDAVFDGVEVFGGSEAPTLAGLFNGFIDGVGPGDYVALQAYVAKSPAVDAALARLRYALRVKTRAAVTVGYGPRFLHSTGQLHKGDGGRGRFIQFTCADAEEVAIPDQPGSGDSSLGFGVLKLSQALGDAGALRDAGRRVIRFHASTDGAETILKLAGL